VFSNSKCAARWEARIGYNKTASPIALEVLEQIAALFAIEGHIRGRPPNLRAAARREHAQPRLDRLKSYLDIQITRISGKSDLAEAIRYTLSRWKALTRYVREGRLEMSNNAAERAMKPRLSAGRIIYSVDRMLAVSVPPACTPLWNLQR
jgi:transposase